MKQQDQFKGKEISEFIDRCTARWLFEKTGVELYQHAMQKCPPEHKARLQEICDQEKEHEEMLEEVIRDYGGDPHQLTPWARITKIESEGIVQVVTNEDYKSVIDALLDAELVDTASWEMLIYMARMAGARDCIPRFEEALKHETEHLRFIRETILKSISGVAARKAAA